MLSTEPVSAAISPHSLHVLVAIAVRRECQMMNQSSMRLHSDKCTVKLVMLAIR